VEANWELAHEYGQGCKVSVDINSLTLNDDIVRANVRHHLVPPGTDKRNQKPVQEIVFDKEFHLGNNRSRYHSITFIYLDGSVAEPLRAEPKWADADEGSLAELNYIRNSARLRSMRLEALQSRLAAASDDETEDQDIGKADQNKWKPPPPSASPPLPHAWKAKSGGYTGSGSGPNAFAQSRNTVRSFLINSARWVIALPAALVVSWLATRAALFVFGFRVGLSPWMISLLVHALGGSMIGLVGVYLAPNRKGIALSLCTLLSLVIAVAYFTRYNDLVGGLSAATYVIATVVAGFRAIEDS